MALLVKRRMFIIYAHENLRPIGRRNSNFNSYEPNTYPYDTKPVLWVEVGTLGARQVKHDEESRDPFVGKTEGRK